MALSMQQTQLIMRIGVMTMAALTFGLAVRLVLENGELEKILPATLTRTLLLIAAPLTSLAILHYTLAVRSFGVRSLRYELASFVGEASIFIAIVSPLLIGSWVTVAGENCGRWLRACPDELMWMPLWWVAPAGIAMSVILIGGALVFEMRRRNNTLGFLGARSQSRVEGRT